MQTIEIPNFKTLSLKHVVLDYNGTIAKDGDLKRELHELLPLLMEKYEVHVITADTFGSVHKQLEGFDVNIKVITSDDHTQEKADYIEHLVASQCAAIGNGNNDAKMLKSAAVGVALLGDEGCSVESMKESDLLCKNIRDALELFLYPKRLIASLRK